MSYTQSTSCSCSWRSLGTDSSAGPAGELKSGNCDPNPLRIQCKKPILSCFVRTKGKLAEPCNACLISLKQMIHILNPFSPRLLLRVLTVRLMPILYYNTILPPTYCGGCPHVLGVSFPHIVGVTPPITYCGGCPHHVGVAPPHLGDQQL